MLIFAPKILKEILGNLPTIIFKSVNITEVLKEAAPFLIGFTQPRLASKNKQLLTSLPSCISIGSQVKSKISSSDGEAILRLYFSQFLNPNGLVLDIRDIHFSKKESQVIWSPNNTWYKFQEDFRLALLKLYRGFYTNDDNLYSEGLEGLGLTSNLSTLQTEELKKLFNSHFGEDQSHLSFKLETFNNSFSDLFKFFIKNEVKIKTDFIFLGVYLITLYMNLEKAAGSYNVRKIFEEVVLEEVKG